MKVRCYHIVDESSYNRLKNIMSTIRDSAHTDSRHCNFLEDVRRNHNTSRILR
jgi:hypothetical protein